MVVAYNDLPDACKLLDEASYEECIAENSPLLAGNVDVCEMLQASWDAVFVCIGGQSATCMDAVEDFCEKYDASLQLAGTIECSLQCDHVNLVLVVGVPVGVFCFFLMVGFLYCFLRRKRRQGRRQQELAVFAPRDVTGMVEVPVAEPAER